MLNNNLTKTLSIKDYLFQVIVVCGLGLIIGALCGLFSGFLVFVILAALFFLYATIKRPELGLLGILVATSSIVFEDQLPLIPAGGLSLHLPDILLLGMLGLIIIRWLVEHNFKLLATPIDWPLIAFFLLTLISTIIAISQSNTDIVLSRSMIRTMSYYLSFFIVTNLIRERRQLNLLINGIFLLASIVSVVMVVQYLVGSSVSILPGRVEVLTTQGINYNDVTRILPPGVAILLVAFLASLCVLLLEKNKSFVVLKFLQFGLFGLALLFTFLRSYWGVLIIAFILLIMILRGQERRKFVNWSVGILLIAGIILTIVFNIPNTKVVGLVNASVERLQTIFSLETYQGQDSSLNWRTIENGYAVDQIITHPILGSGMGSTYRPYNSRLDTPANNLRWFIHNGHLRILLDSGIIGYLAFIVLSMVFLIRGFRNWKNIKR